MLVMTISIEVAASCPHHEAGPGLLDSVQIKSKQMALAPKDLLENLLLESICDWLALSGYM